ncbi:MAG: gliding motility-associated C-terminal domain-containing protein [bacterium]|nr:gliding motility-associated C-terminal domain-containing protein [bacterium]
MNLKVNIVSVLLFINFYAFAQKENYNWIGGQDLGINFDSIKPRLFDNKLSWFFYYSRRSGISDSQGKLLLYSTGDSLMNGKGKRLINWTINSIYNPVQAPFTTLIIKKPLSNNLYYVFRIRGHYINNEKVIDSEPGFSYSIVDMNGNSGNGMVLKKNVKIYDKQLLIGDVTAVYHANKKDIWILLSNRLENTLQTFLLSDKGLSVEMVSRSFVSESNVVSNTRSMPKFSLDGKYFAISEPVEGKYGKANQKLHVFRFNDSNGQINEDKYINTLNRSGFEFSPNSQFIYFSSDTSTVNKTKNFIFYQCDLKKLKQVTEISDCQVIANEDIQDLLLGPDGKIYCSSQQEFTSHTYIGVIHFPNSPVNNIKYEKDYINIAATFGTKPYSIASLFPKILAMPITKKMEINGKCNLDSIEFIAHNSYYGPFRWQFSDGDTGISTNNSIKHFFKDTGTYKVLAIVKNSEGFDTLEGKVHIRGIDKPRLGNDTIICNQSNLTLTINNPSWTSILWQDSSNNNTLTIRDTGTYFVSVQNDYCKEADTIKIYKINCDLKINGICFGDSTSLNFNDTNDHQKIVKWGDNFMDTSENISIKHKYASPKNHNGTVHIVYKNARIELPFTANIIQVEKPQLGNDTIICSNENFDLSVSNNSYDSIKWITGSTQSNLQVSKSGYYWVRVKNKNCLNSDTIKIINLNCDLSINGFCVNDSTTFQLESDEVDSFQFNFGDGRVNSFKKSHYFSNLYLDIKPYNINYIYYKDGLYLKRDISVSIKDCDCIVFVPDAFSPDKNFINDVFLPVTECNLNEISLEIYDRWGGVIYKTTTYLPTWNGCDSKGNVLQNGVYVWMIKYINPTTNKLQLKTGSVTLMR